MGRAEESTRWRRGALLGLLLLLLVGGVVLNARDDPRPASPVASPAGREEGSTPPPAPRAAVPRAVVPAPEPAESVSSPPGEDDSARGSVFALVTDLDGSPVADAELFIERPAGPGMTISMSAPRPPGEFRTTLPPGPWRVRARSETHLPQEQIITVEPDREVRTEIRLDPGLWITGTLMIPAKGPASGARIVVKGPGDPTEGRTDPEGRFRVGPLTPGRWELSATGRGFLRHSLSVPVRAAAGAALGEISLDPGSPLRGFVLDGARSSVAGARVLAKGGTWTRTKSDGSFSLSAVPHRGVRLEIDAEGFLPFRTRVAEEQLPGPVRLQLSRGGLLRGVLRSGDGAPAVDIVIEALDIQGEWSDSAWTDDEGRFELRLAPGRYRLREEEQEVVLAEVDLAEGDEVDLELVR